MGPEPTHPSSRKRPLPPADQPHCASLPDAPGRDECKDVCSARLIPCALLVELGNEGIPNSQTRSGNVCTYSFHILIPQRRGKMTVLRLLIPYPLPVGYTPNLWVAKENGMKMSEVHWRQPQGLTPLSVRRTSKWQPTSVPQSNQVSWPGIFGLLGCGRL